MPPKLNKDLETMAPLTFAIVGYSHDHEVVTPIGTGFFISPYVAVTAKHIAEGLWKELAPEWQQSKYPSRATNPSFSVRLFHAPDPRAPYALAEWEVTGCTRTAYTDVAFLHAVPNNEQAERSAREAKFAELQLLPPVEGEAVCAVGFPGMSPSYTKGAPGFVVHAAMRVEDGEVIEHHENGRGSWRFPQFQVSVRCGHGMSGAPVLYRGQICGIVSYGADYEDGTGDWYIAPLWPLLLQEIPLNIDPRLNNLPLLDLLRHGNVIAPGWREVLKRAFVDRTEPDRPIAALRRILSPN